MMNVRQIFALVVMGATPVFALAEQTKTPSMGPPVSESNLSEYRGTHGSTFNFQSSDGQLYDNHAENTISGNNYISDQAFSGANGFPTVIQNSGNNVLIQNSTIVNVKVQ